MKSFGEFFHVINFYIVSLLIAVTFPTTAFSTKGQCPDPSNSSTLWYVDYNNSGSTGIFTIELGESGGTKTYDSTGNDMYGDIAVSPDGYIYVASMWTHEIIEFSKDGRRQKRSLGSLGGISNPNGLAFDKNGYLYVGYSKGKYYQVKDINKLSSYQEWFDPNDFFSGENVGSSGDVIFVGDKVYVSINDNYWTDYLIELTVSSNNKIQAQKIVGKLPERSYGLSTDGFGRVFVSSDNSIMEIDISNSSMFSRSYSIPKNTVASTNQKISGLSSVNESLSGGSCKTEPKPTIQNGVLRYANSGTGEYKDRILFMDWANSSLKDGIQDGDVVNFDIPAQSCLAGGTLKATFTNVIDPAGVASETKPHDMQTSGSASFHQLYNTAGTGEAIYTPPLSTTGGSGQLDFTINWSWQPGKGGQVAAPDIFLMDAESTQVGKEQIDVSTNGDVWSIIENSSGDQYVINGAGSKSIQVVQTSANSQKGAPLLLSKGMTETRVTIRSINSNGSGAVAFGLLAPCDHGDAPASFGDAAHALKEEPISSSKNQLGLKLSNGAPFIGNIAPDSEFYQTSVLASQDNDIHDAFDRSRDNDEDGVSIGSFVQGKSNDITIPVSGSGYLQGWIDWNADGDFNDANEQIARDMQSNGGNVVLSISTPSDASLGSTYARFRYSSETGLASTGVARDGEVEDSMLEIGDNICRVDSLSSGVYTTSSVATNSGYLTDSTRVYQLKFNNDGWTGHLFSYDLKTAGDDGNIKDKKWDAASEMTRTGRTIISYNPSLTAGKGIIFNWTSLNSAQKNLLKNGGNESLGQKRLHWVAGSDADEGSLFRQRTTILGDVIHSGLSYQDPLINYGYKYLNGAEKSSYAAFLTSKKTKQAILYVGANDGMLHAINADNGEETFAYIPNEVYSKLATISDKKYGCRGTGCLRHEYLVDGTSSVNDAYFDGAWHTVLVGTLGLGGKGIFALDVTDPSSFNRNKVLWEISENQATVDNSNASVYKNLLGNTLPSSRVVRLRNGKWAAIVANGYDSREQTAALFIIDIETGGLIKKFVVPAIANTNNGLSTATPVDSNSDYLVDVIYAGDLLGNLWAFDVDDTDPTNWSIKYGTTLAPEPLFKACEGNTCPPVQNITAAPQVGKHADGGLMVYFGTGKYFDINDNMFDGATPPVNSFYAIRDNGKKVTKSTLIEQSILNEVTVGKDLKSRVTSKNLVNYANENGWFMDLKNPASMGVREQGERVISQALLRGGRIIFTTMTPPGNSCSWGGTSWVMEFDAISGQPLKVVPFDTNNDKQFTEDDNVTIDGKSRIISGIQKPSLGVIFSTPAVITHNTRTEGKYVTGTGGSVGMIRESASTFSGRMSWRKLR